MEFLNKKIVLATALVLALAGCEFTDNLLGSRPSIDANHSPSISEEGEPFESFQSALSFTGSDQRVEVPAGATTLTVKMWGAGGGGSRFVATNRRNNGGAGAYTEASFDVSTFPSTNLIAVVGLGGLNRLHSDVQTSNYLGGGPAGVGTCPAGGGASGGGLVGLFLGSISQSNALIISGSGGGASNSNVGSTNSISIGGAGGTEGLPSTAGTNSFQSGSVSGGGAGSAVAGGSAGTNGFAGSILAGGAGGVANQCGGGGGAGYFGGGGGGSAGSFFEAPGGGGSGYVSASALIIFEEVSADILAPNTADPDYPGSPIAEGGSADANGGSGYIILIWE